MWGGFIRPNFPKNVHCRKDNSKKCRKAEQKQKELFYGTFGKEWFMCTVYVKWSLVVKW